MVQPAQLQHSACDFDHVERPHRQRELLGDGRPLGFQLTLDAVGNPTQIVRAGDLPGTTTYTYDTRDRLTESCFDTGCSDYIRWTFDGVGNHLTEQRPSGTTSYTYNAADELTQAGAASFSYDQDGRETAASSRTFSYDLANRLASTTSGGQTTSYSYDGDGNRVQATAGAGVTKYLWDTNQDLPQLALERDGAGSLLRRYVYGHRRVSFASGGSSFYYHYDNLGSVANVTSAGAAQWTYAYEPYGSIRTETQNDPNAPQNPMKFGSELVDPSGLYYLRARQYDPTLGRFLTRDPAEPSVEDPMVAAHVYAADRPGLLVDPSGETFEYYDAAQNAADEATTSCNDARGWSARIRCAYKFLTGRFNAGTYQHRSDRYPRKHSAGLVGNFWDETERNPLDPTTQTPVFTGIAQWSSDRWNLLVTWAHRKGLSEWKLQTQLSFVWYELHTSELKAFGKIWVTATVDAAARAVARHYERADPATYDHRATLAKRVYNNY